MKLKLFKPKKYEGKTIDEWILEANVYKHLYEHCLLEKRAMSHAISQAAQAGIISVKAETEITAYYYNERKQINDLLNEKEKSD